MAEIDNLIAEVNKKYKTDIIRKASDLKGIEFIPYTSPMMNYLTRGGVPVGRIIELVGLPQSGKTTTALDIISNFQKKYKDKYCVYLDAENTIDKEWGETLGVDWSKVILIQPESEYGEELLDMLLDYIRSGKVGLAVLDSAPFIIPKAVQEKGLDEKSYGGNSALMKAFCDKAVPLCKKTECTFLMINQLRENIGNPYKPFKIPCGTAIAHACSQILSIPVITCWVRDDNYVSATGEIYLTEPELEPFLHQFRHHLQNVERKYDRRGLTAEGLNGLYYKVPYTKCVYKLYGEDDARAWARMVIELAS